MWLFNIGYGNLCWGSSFGLNNFELPNSVNPIYLSWALNKTNNWFFGTLGLTHAEENSRFLFE